MTFTAQTKICAHAHVPMSNDGSMQACTSQATAIEMNGSYWIEMLACWCPYKAFLASLISRLPFVYHINQKDLFRLVKNMALLVPNTKPA